jgi:hypothetical protein
MTIMIFVSFICVTFFFLNLINSTTTILTDDLKLKTPLNTMIEEIIKLLSRYKFPLSNEKELQANIFNTMLPTWKDVVREYPLNNKNVVDLYLQGIAIEVKIHANAKSIYKQCVRYCEFDSVKQLILVTNRSMGFPKEINGKPCYVINIGKAWL